MSEMTDLNQNKWRIRLTTKAVRDIQDTHGVNLLNVDSDPMTTLATNPMVLADAAYLICEKQAKERGISDEDFGELFDPDSAYAAIEEAIIESFPSGQTSHVREVLANFQRMREKSMGLARQQMEKIYQSDQVDKTLTERAQREIDQQLRKIASGEA